MTSAVRNQKAQDETVPFLRDVLCGSVSLPTVGLGRCTIDWARKNKIAPFLASKLIAQDLDDATLTEWAKIYRAQCIKRSQAVLDELRAVYQEFHADDVVGVVVVENFGTLIATGGDLGNFASGDVDLMGPRAEAGRISACIENAGWQRTVRRGVADYIMTTYEKKIDGDVFYLNIEWKFVSRRFFFDQSRLARRMKMWRHDGFLQRCAGIDVLTDDANFYLNCMHLSIGHYYGTNPGLRLYKDIEPYLSGGHRVSFDRVMGWADEDGTRLRVETCLALYKAIYDEMVEMPIAISLGATKLSRHVQSILDPQHIKNFSRFQEVRIDQISEEMSLPAYLAKRLTYSLARV